MASYTSTSTNGNMRSNIETTSTADNSSVKMGETTTNYFKALNSQLDGISDNSEKLNDGDSFQVEDKTNVSNWFNEVVGEYNLSKGRIIKGGVMFDKAFIDGGFVDNDGWYSKTSEKGTVIFGSDDAKPLVITNSENKYNYDSVKNTVIALDDTYTTPVRVFGSDKADNITIDGATVDFISTGTGDDKITLLNGAQITNDINTGDGNDSVSLTGENTLVKGDIFTNDGADTITMTNKSTVMKNINSGDSDDTISMDSWAKVLKTTYARDGKDTISLNGGSNVGIDIEAGGGNDEISILGGSTVKNTIFGNDGDDTIRVIGDSTVHGMIEGGKGDVNMEITDSTIHNQVRTGLTYDSGNSMGDNAQDYLFQGGGIIKINNSTVNGAIDLNGTGHNQLEITKGSKINGVIFGGHHSDFTAKISSSTIAHQIEAEGGKNEIFVNNSSIGGNIELNNRIEESHTIVVENGSTINGYITGGSQPDTIIVSVGYR